ncbi:MAG: M20 family metallopeptidase [Candidatus Heimdallarchaeota archaeon]
MIRINSVVGNEKELAQFLYAELNALGMECRLEEVEPNRPNVYGTLRGEGNGKKLNFNGHTDTVPVVEGWSSDPFVPHIRNGRIYGLGSSDMKAGIACEMAMLRAFVESDYAFKGELSFSGVIDEEAHGKGAKAMLQTEFAKVDAIVLAEPFPGDKSKPIPLGITGKILYNIRVRGKAAHGFQPEFGINAIEELGRILVSLEQLPFRHHPDFGKGNYSTLKIEGGYGEVYSVVVPASARAEINRLLVPGETIKTAIIDMEELIGSLGLSANVEVGIKPPHYESFVLDKGEPIFQAFDSAYKEVMGTAPQYGYTSGITDANIFAGEGGIPCLHFGPPQVVAHQKDEYVSVEWLATLSKIYALLALRYFGAIF